MMTVHPCAKVNLGLYVVERREDGYHNLQTVFFPIPLCDELSVEELHVGESEKLANDSFEKDEFLLSGIPVAGETKDNLVMKVLRDLREEYPIPPLCIHLVKNIPSGAGLGGGSSDAAFMLRLLNEKYHLGLSAEEMEVRVSRFGADCAFFVHCQPTMAEGIGNIFSPIHLSLEGKFLVLVKPNDFVSTKEAYSHVLPENPQFDLRQTVEGDIRLWRERLQNDFERSVLPVHPTISEIKLKLYELGAEFALMSGSGSAVFALFSCPVQDLQSHFASHLVFSAQL